MNALAAAAVLAALAGASGACAVEPDRGAASPAGAAAAAAPGAASVICGPEEPGERLVFEGRVLDYGGRPLAKAAVVAYHTDSEGLYNPPDSATRVPRLRGVAVTDGEGRFRFETIRPAAYPNASEPAHLHVSVLAPAHHPRFLEIWFEGDPLIGARQRERASGNSNLVIATLRRGESGAHHFEHDIRLEGN